MNRDFSLIKQIIDRKKQGIDCTEQESADVKGWLRETILSPHDDSIEIESEIQSIFPLEYGEYLDEEINLN